MTKDPSVYCVHGKVIYERCVPCEVDMKAGKHGGFERAQEAPSAAEIPERLTFVLGSGQSATMDKAGAGRWLKHLFEFYNGEEKDWHDKTYNGERTPGGFSQANENEWMRYRQEAASLAFAIQIISGEAP